MTGAVAAGTDEQDDPDEPERNTGGGGPVDPATAEQGREQRHPERDGRDDERHESRRQVLLAPGDAAIAEEEQAGSDDQGGAPVHPSEPLPRLPGAPGEGVQEQARDDESHARHEERGQRLDRDVDREIRRPPDHVDERERHDDLRARGAGGRDLESGHARSHLLWYKAVNVPIRYHITGRRASEIAESIERGIREGDLTAGTRLPTVRSLASHRGISTATVASAYRELRRRGLVAGAGRLGTSIAPRVPPSPRGRPIVPPAFATSSRATPIRRCSPTSGPALAVTAPRAGALRQRRLRSGADRARGARLRGAMASRAST